MICDGKYSMQGNARMIDEIQRKGGPKIGGSGSFRTSSSHDNDGNRPHPFSISIFVNDWWVRKGGRNIDRYPVEENSQHACTCTFDNKPSNERMKQEQKHTRLLLLECPSPAARHPEPPCWRRRWPRERRKRDPENSYWWSLPRSWQRW